jgi:hypothetical protein
MSKRALDLDRFFQNYEVHLISDIKITSASWLVPILRGKLLYSLHRRGEHWIHGLSAERIV